MEDIQFTWRDLKRAVNKMPESRLDDQVTIWTEDGANTVENVMVLAENYVNDGDEAVVPNHGMFGYINGDPAGTLALTAKKALNQFSSPKQQDK